MKKNMLTLLLSILMLSLSARDNNIGSSVDTSEILYPICLHFQSVCCGVPEEKKLKKWIQTFKRKHGIRKMSAIHVGPLGREGEYDLYFTLKGISPKTARSFIKGIKKQSMKMKEPGMVSTEENAVLNRSNLPVTASYDTLYY